ncbi:hypothetical protein GGG16DRAFT_119626, partial [Schizophyllum commune]
YDSWLSPNAHHQSTPNALTLVYAILAIPPTPIFRDGHLALAAIDADVALSSLASLRAEDSPLNAVSAMLASPSSDVVTNPTSTPRHAATLAVADPSNSGHPHPPPFA